MSVPARVSLQTVIAELAVAVPYASAAGIGLGTTTLTETNLKFYATFYNQNKEPFYAEFDCAEYPLFPPTIEFVDEARSARGLKSLYPAGFHPTPCVCMRYNRKAYGERGGPHGDWRLIDWQLPTPGGGPIDSLAMILSDLHSKIFESTGRMG
jgi:hypothetical protein